MSVPERAWIHDVSTSFPETTFRVATALAGEDAGVALVEVRAENPLPVLGALQRRDDVVALELLWKHGREALFQVEATSAPLLLPAWRAGVPLEMPFDIQDGTTTWELTTSTARLSAFGDALDEAGIDYDIEYVADAGSDEADRLLTPRQQEVLLAAVDRGYYATPRETTLTEVADDMGVSKATCSDVLHRAEGSIVGWFVDEHVG